MNLNIILPAIITIIYAIHNNICYSFTTEQGIDISLNDRKKEFINNNMSLCESNCNYKGYNNEIKKSKCECEIKIKIPLFSAIIINKNKLYNSFVDIKNSTNIKVMRCYKSLFTLDGIKKNIGFYILISIIFIIIILCISFIFKGYKLLYNEINKIYIYQKNQKKLNPTSDEKSEENGIKNKSKMIKNNKMSRNNNNNINTPNGIINIININNNNKIKIKKKNKKKR